MTVERENAMRQLAGISIARQRSIGLNQPKTPANLPYIGPVRALPSAPRVVGAPLSPLLLSVLLIGSQGLLIVACNLLLALVGEGERGTPDFHEAAIGGIGVAILFTMIRPMIRLSTAGPRESAVFSISLPGTLAAVALAELAGLGAYAYLAHYLGTSVPPVSFHHWPRAWAMATVAVGVMDIAAGHMIAKWSRERRLAKRILVYGGGEHVARFISDASARWPTRLLVCGYFDDRTETSREAIGGVPCLGGSRQLVDHVRSERIDEIVIALPWTADQHIMEILRRFRHLPVPIRLAPDLMMLNILEKRQQVESFCSLTIRDQPVSEWNLIVKSLFDRMLATFLLVLTLPTMAAIAFLIKLDGSGPIFFRQKRLGFNDQPFDVLKFRTMTLGDDQQAGARQAQRGDRRVTRVGRFLRRSSLDELPQLFNVLRGEMSLVGPRPHPMWARADELWPDQGDRPLDAIFSEYASRHRMKPGITGWAQVCGYRGETETPEKMAKRVEHDIYYIDNWSLWLDVRILVKTVMTVVGDKNAY
jgi:Undecaprenyl-phosphate glucose phosphotransferase